MRLDHPDYIKLVIAAYQEKRLTNELPPLLAKPTPANIRRECVTVYQERYDKKDEPMLRAFFGHAEPGRKFQALIENFDVDKFRPLDGFLKGVRTITDRNVELLAWLIDFKYRPFVFGMEVFLTDKELQALKIDTPPGDPEPGDATKDHGEPGQAEPPSTPTPPNQDWKKRLKKAAVSLLALLVTGTGVFFIYDKLTETGPPISLGAVNTSCMYWEKDHYEKVPCNEDPKGRFFLPLEEERRKKFFKIMKEDTITERSIGRIYYLKTNNKKEYFTAGGNHPIFTTRALKVFSRYIYEKEFLKKDSLEKDSMAKNK